MQPHANDQRCGWTRGGGGGRGGRVPLLGWKRTREDEDARGGVGRGWEKTSQGRVRVPPRHILESQKNLTSSSTFCRRCLTSSSLEPSAHRAAPSSSAGDAAFPDISPEPARAPTPAPRPPGKRISPSKEIFEAPILGSFLFTRDRQGTYPVGVSQKIGVALFVGIVRKVGFQGR